MPEQCSPEQCFDVRQLAYQVIMLEQPAEKVAATAALWERWQAGHISINHRLTALAITQPGRSAKLRLVAPEGLERRSLHTNKGKAVLVHAIAHIEFNAIDLALDAVYRFREMPTQYYADWLGVAEQEAQHFLLVWRYLQDLGYDYGDFPAHNGLWAMALETSSDVLVRMALVPRVLEARGLDVTPGIIKRFRDIHDLEFAQILEVIQRDEVGHVACGSRWFHDLCDRRGLQRQDTFEQILQQYTKSRVKLPLARDARLKAGFTDEELAYLEGLC